MINYDTRILIQQWRISNPKENNILTIVVDVLRLPLILPLYCLSVIGESALHTSYILDSKLGTAKDYYIKLRISKIGGGKL